MEKITGSKGLDAACAQMMAAMLAILIHPGYDPTTIGPMLHEMAKRMAKDPVFQMLAGLSLKQGSPRDITKEVEDILRGAWPLGFADKAEPAASESERAVNSAAAALALELPYGDQGREFQELLAVIEKAEGRPLTDEEKLRTVRAFNKAVNEGKPHTITFNGKNVYLAVSAGPLTDGLDALMANLDHALR